MMILSSMRVDLMSEDWEAMKQRIEIYGRTCYKSTAKITEQSASKFLSMLIKRGHFSVFDHEVVHVRFIADRGFTHELVRHRMAAYSQESTRYCNYKGGVEFIIPTYLEDRVIPGTYTTQNVSGAVPDSSDDIAFIWAYAMAENEAHYLRLLEGGVSVEHARGVLPIDLKTEIVITADLTEWRHIFSLRTSKAAHPHMRKLMTKLCKEMAECLPEVFEDIARKL